MRYSTPQAILLLLGTLTLVTACGGGGDTAGGGVAAGFKITAIGPGGGTAVSADGFVQLLFPPGALDTTQDIRITRLEAADLSVEMALLNPDGIYSFEPDGLAFNLPVTLSFDLGNPTVSTPGNIAANLPVVLVESGGTIEYQGGGGFEITADSVLFEAPIEHFSNYGWMSDSDLAVQIGVSYPLAVGTAGGSFQAEFVADGGPLVTNNIFEEWFFSATKLDISAGSTTTPRATGNLYCIGSAEPGSFFAQADYILRSPGGGEVTNFCTVQATGIDTSGCSSSGGFQEPEYVDLAALGITYPEGIDYTSTDCSTVKGGHFFHIGAQGGGYTVQRGISSYSYTVLRSEARNSSHYGFSFTPLSGPNGVYTANRFASFNASDTTAFDGSCSPFFPMPTTGSVDCARVDGTDPSAGTIGVNIEGTVIRMTSLDSLGYVGGYNVGISSYGSTAISNGAQDKFLLASTSPSKLYLVAGNSIKVGNNTETAVMGLGSDPRRLRWDPDSGLVALSDFTDSQIYLWMWDGSGTPTHIDTVDVCSGPVGIDVDGDKVVCAGFNDDKFSIIDVDLNGLAVRSVSTQAIPFTSPYGGNLRPGHAVFLRDGNRSVLFSMWEACGMAILPAAY